MHTGSIVLVDTNVILECHRTNTWDALSGGYRVQTTEACVCETQTGFQKLTYEQYIDPEQLRESLDAVHTVSDREYATLELRALDLPELDDGERSLWAHVVSRGDDDWFFCGPDVASLRCGVKLGYQEQLTSLEDLLTRIGHRNTSPLKHQYRSKWHRTKTAELALEYLSSQ